MPRARKPASSSKLPQATVDKAKIGNELLETLGPAPERRRDGALRELFSRIAADNVERETPAIRLLHRIGDRWSSLILVILDCGTLRHSELHRVVKFICATNSTTSISQRILTQKLRALERDGMLTRAIWPTVPLRTEYTLTPLGHHLAEWVNGLVQWCDENRAAIDAAQRDYDDKQ